MAEPSKKVIRAENAPTFYVNNVELRSTQFDFRFSLGDVAEANDNQLTIKHLVDIYMSPQHAKTLCKLLNAQIQKWEEKVGPISLIEEGSS